MKNLIKFIKKERLFLIIAVVLLTITGIVVYKQLNVMPTAAPGVALPEGFPVMPIYPRAKLVDSRSDPLEGALYIGVRYGATWEVKKPLPVVVKWYKEKLQALGWTLDIESSNSDATDVQLSTFYNKDYSLNMSFTREAGSKLTKIIAEFTTLQRDYCDDMHGEVCK